MKTVLVTGGAGFIGSCFVRQLLRDDQYEVVVLDKLTYAGSLENLVEVRENPRLWFQQGDICDKSLLRRLLDTHSPGWVVNFAAESHVDRSIDHPSVFTQTNVLGVCHLLETCLDYWLALPEPARRTFRCLQVSTDEVFGSLGPEGQFTPHSPYAPRSPYAASKAAADHFARAFFHTYRMPTIIANCSNNYGPYQYPEKLIPLMIRRAIAGATLPVYGDGSHVRDWIHVEDHARGLELALQRGTPGEAYLFGGDCERSNLDVVRALCTYLDQLSPASDSNSYLDQIRLVADRPGHDQRYAIDHSKATLALDWQPRIDFDTGLREAVQWYLDHQAWVERITRYACCASRLRSLGSRDGPSSETSE